jgi:hypothetical protein
MSDTLPIGEPLWQPADTVQSQIGTVEDATLTTDHPVAVLWLPDPEQRHWWREYYVKRTPAQKPGARLMGYTKK